MNFVSIDGVVQAPLSADEDRDGGFAQGGWVPPYSDDTVNEFMRKATVGAAGMLLGRRSYEILTAAWAHADDSEPAVAAMNRMPKYVVTSSAGDLEWQNSHRLDADLAPAVGDLKARTDGDLVVFGAATLIQGLAEHDLVDEYRLLLFPIVLGSGKRMFGDRGHPARFTLTDTVLSPSGVVILTYNRDTAA
ncbi:dihydrofolate reductase family protein [Allokutzneria oryzae]|uniref:Dihydrofolate reductase family protein n=1 Tax=Allokutzneria oryzae TaxID=1378989 RepID=A0ABV5ZWG4_9PSEU